MDDQHRLYRALVRLYPRPFRRDYGEDLVQHFADLVTDRGTRAAWARTSLDLTITIPRYHLERIMNDQRSNIALNIALVLLATGGIISFLVGAWLSPLLLVAAGTLAVTQRSALARALRVPDSHVRRRRLRTGAILGVIFVACYATYDRVAWPDGKWTLSMTLLIAVGIPAMFGGIGYLVAGLFTPRTPIRRIDAGVS